MSKIAKKVLTYFMDDPSPLLAHACGKVPKEVLAAVYTTILLLRLMYESVDEQVFLWAIRTMRMIFFYA